MKGLIIKDPWITKILNGEKTWEIRGSNTSMLGIVSLIKSGTGMIFGTVVITNSYEITDEAYEQGFRNHRIPELIPNRYKRRYVWEMSDPIKFKEPIPYKHPQGAVIWVNL